MAIFESLPNEKVGILILAKEQKVRGRGTYSLYMGTFRQHQTGGFQKKNGIKSRKQGLSPEVRLT